MHFRITTLNAFQLHCLYHNGLLFISLYHIVVSLDLLNRLTIFCDNVHTVIAVHVCMAAGLSHVTGIHVQQWWCLKV